MSKYKPADPKGGETSLKNRIAMAQKHNAERATASVESILARVNRAATEPWCAPNGQFPMWIVTRATTVSTLDDICFQATVHDLALQIKGGLDPDEILGWFDNASEANQIALQELYRAGATS